MRLFIAIDVDGELKNKISEVQESLKGFGRINFVDPENLHYTLKFLGEVGEEEVGKIVEMISKVSKGFGKFKVHIKGLGFFGSEKNIRVLWLGCEEGSTELKSIAEALERGLSYIREGEYSYKPHLTIGRVSFLEDIEGFLDMVDKNKGIEIGEFVVSKISLKQSFLGPKGVVYKDYKTFEVGNG